MPCPACLNQNRVTPVEYWSHYEDGGSIYIGSDGFLICSKCDRRSYIRYWRFLCPTHGNNHIIQYSVSLRGSKI